MYDVFSLPEIKFPAGFVWGSSTAGHQIEGDNIYSQLWETEKAYDDGFCGTHVKSGKTCNHYELYPADIELLTRLGHQAFRMSIEWSRIEPAEGRFDTEAVKHYIDELALLKKHGIKVFVTLHHFTHPLWFEKLGQFYILENVKYFERYLEYIVPQISEYVDFWNVINEFNLGNEEQRITYKLNMIRAHARGYHIIKKYSRAPVSSAHAFVHYMPYRPYDKYDKLMTEFCDFRDHEFFFHAIRTGEILYPMRDARYDPDVKGTVDYWSVNCYTRDMIDARKADCKGKRYNHKELKMIDMDFYLEEMYPEGVIAILGRLTDYPVYITENGCSCNDDRFRIVYLALYLAALKEAIDLGVDVRGYLYWSLLDNYEWGSYLPRFGLVNVDFATFERTVKPSAEFYREIIQNNGFSGETVKKYLSELPRL